MRTAIIALLFCALTLGCPGLLAASTDNSIPDPGELAALQARAEQAQPRDRCFLYAKLVDRMTLLAGSQLNNGDSGHASATLRSIQRYAQMVKDGIAEDSRKLKNAEMLLQQTSFRMQDILRSASYQDRPPLEATLKQLNQVQSQLMMQVFAR